MKWLACGLLLLLPAGGLAAAGVDYAESRHAGLWLQHPVYGGPSFDAFVHSPQNPLHRGAPPFEWPVNSFFFADPVSGTWYLYVGDYCEGYAARPSRCVLLRSTDRGQSWTNLGVVLQGSKELFDQGGRTPDVSVVYAGGRYHMVYDWVEPDWSQLGGLAYAWAEKPEGPFHRAPQPITRNKELTPLLDRYRRTYAATLLRRRHDWMIVAMMDHAPNSWALFAFTAPNSEGPYGERALLRNVEADGFHPPLLEFYPAFVHRGYVYAPATSVALDRKQGGETSLIVDGRPLWTGELPPRRATGVRPSSGAATSAGNGVSELSSTPGRSELAAPEDGRTLGQSLPGVLGIAVEAHSHLVVECFAIQGKPQPATINFLYTEAILGAGGSAKDWRGLHGPEFRYGLAAVSTAPGARVKWNVEGGQFLLWSPRGPEFGKAQVKVDGRVFANLDLHAERLMPAEPIWKSPRLKDGAHAVALSVTDALLVVDSIEVTR